MSYIGFDETQLQVAISQDLKTNSKEVVASIYALDSAVEDLTFAVSANNKRLGEIFIYLGDIAPLGSLELNGQIIEDADQSYPDFYNWVINETHDTCTFSEYEDILNINNFCNKFGIDGKNIRLPLFNPINISGKFYITVYNKIHTSDELKLLYENWIIPSRGIICWAGNVNEIPVGWHLCDGTYGTPDLRDKFIIGAGKTYSPNETGGNNFIDKFVGKTGNMLLIGSGTGEENDINGPLEFDKTIADSNDNDINDTNPSHIHTFSTLSKVDNRPAFYALAYIMKL